MLTPSIPPRTGQHVITCFRGHYLHADPTPQVIKIETVNWQASYVSYAGLSITYLLGPRDRCDGLRDIEYILDATLMIGETVTLAINSSNRTITKNGSLLAKITRLS